MEKGKCECKLILYKRMSLFQRSAYRKATRRTPSDHEAAQYLGEKVRVITEEVEDISRGQIIKVF